MLASEWSTNCALEFGTPPHTANNLQRLGQNIYISHGKAMQCPLYCMANDNLG